MNIIECDMVKCVYNKRCYCSRGKISIVLTHDEISKKEYIKCSNLELKGEIKYEIKRY